MALLLLLLLSDCTCIDKEGPMVNNPIVKQIVHGVWPTEWYRLSVLPRCKNNMGCQLMLKVCKVQCRLLGQLLRETRSVMHTCHSHFRA